MFFEAVENCVAQFLGLSEKIDILTFLGFAMGGIFLALQAVIANKRAVAMENAGKAQAISTERQAEANQNTEQGMRQERLKNAIEHLGHREVSVRLGGAYELIHLAKDTEHLRQTALNILCAHIRQITSESKYRDLYKSKPSEEIQSLLIILFVEHNKIFQGLHINLQGCWLNGAELAFARLEQAYLSRASLEGTDLRFARLQEANLDQANLQNAVLTRIHLQKADLSGVQLQKAALIHSQLQGANLNHAQLQNATLSEACLQGANLNNASLLGVDLGFAYLQGANLNYALLHAADLTDASMQGASLKSTIFLEATLDGTSLEGVTSRSFNPMTSFNERINGRIGENSELSQATFAGGLKQETLDMLLDGMADGYAEALKEKLVKHVDQPKSNKLPEDSRAIVGRYTKDQAEEWIANYEEAISGETNNIVR